MRSANFRASLISPQSKPVPTHQWAPIYSKKQKLFDNGQRATVKTLKIARWFTRIFALRFDYGLLQNGRLSSWIRPDCSSYLFHENCEASAINNLVTTHVHVPSIRVYEATQTLLGQDFRLIA